MPRKDRPTTTGLLRDDVHLPTHIVVIIAIVLLGIVGGGAAIVYVSFFRPPTLSQPTPLAQLSPTVKLPAASPPLPLIREVALPSIIVPPAGHAAIQGMPFDGFDFQTLDPQTGLLFITHAGPGASKLLLDQQQLPPGTRLQSQLVVFDTRQQAVVGKLAIPNVHGVVAVPELGRVYAADVKDERIYVIDERTRQIMTTIALGLHPCATLPCVGPDALAYDPADRKIFVSDNGIDNAHQNLGVIDVQTNRLVAEIPLGQDRFGDVIGHPQYDPPSHHLYVTVQPQVPQPATTPTSTPTTPALPPGQLLTVDSVNLKVLARLTFSDTHACSDPHGLVIDSAQQVAFTACRVTHSLLMIDLKSLKLSAPSPVVLKPDILRLDLTTHRLYVPGTSGVSIFDEHAAASGILKKLGNFAVSKGSSHTMEVDPHSHVLYFPVQDAQGKPVLRVLQPPS